MDRVYGCFELFVREAAHRLLLLLLLLLLSRSLNGMHNHSDNFIPFVPA